jgi:hypothetical protein
MQSAINSLDSTTNSTLLCTNHRIKNHIRCILNHLFCCLHFRYCNTHSIRKNFIRNILNIHHNIFDNCFSESFLIFPTKNFCKYCFSNILIFLIYLSWNFSEEFALVFFISINFFDTFLIKSCWNITQMFNFNG